MIAQTQLEIKDIFENCQRFLIRAIKRDDLPDRLEGQAPSQLP